ncbi:MAG: rRNA pseudouridine synthase [Lachnospiraceae bacterium]|nr:rRNA pseudouridine synthase [Ruminococcus sp.]MCM1274201.1 rRNA pseudouridine synthase [Lachnospiraceae bacterium]
MEKARIQKIIAESGYCSRRKAEELISQGAVTVNGRPCSLGDKADAGRDVIRIHGETIGAVPAEKRYIMLNKPRGYITTMSDEQGRRTAVELLEGVEERVVPVGRLDRNSEGLLLFTNDGAFANEITHPSRHVSKTYRVTVDGRVSEEQVMRLSAGVVLDDGEKTLPCAVDVLVEEPERTVLRIVIKQGLNRQIRRMCAAVGLNVGRLRRVAIGGVKLGMLKSGEWRDLTKDELRILRAAVGKSRKSR